MPLGGTAAAARPSEANPAPAGDWVRSACGALVTLRGDVERAANDATNAAQKARKLSDSAQVRRAKQAILTFLGAATDAATTAESDLRAIGDLPAMNSAAVEDALVALALQVSSGWDDLESPQARCHVVPNGHAPSPYRCSQKLRVEVLQRGAAFGLGTRVVLVDWEITGP